MLHSSAGRRLRSCWRGNAPRRLTSTRTASCYGSVTSSYGSGRELWQLAMALGKEGVHSNGLCGLVCRQCSCRTQALLASSSHQLACMPPACARTTTTPASHSAPGAPNLQEIVTGQRPRRGQLRLPRVPQECPQVGLQGRHCQLADSSQSRRAGGTAGGHAATRGSVAVQACRWVVSAITDRTLCCPCCRHAGCQRPHLSVPPPRPRQAPHSAGAAAATRPAGLPACATCACPPAS